MNFSISMKKRKKIIITVLSVILALVLLSLGIVGISNLFSPKINTLSPSGGGDISFCPADYEEDIFADKIYAKKQKDVFFSYDGEGEFITAQNYLSANVSGKMFYNYFDCVIKGEYSVYPAFFSDEFKEDAILPEKFTMQKLYDISVTLESRQPYEQGYVELYSVRYRIMDNNGTFRSDLKDDTVIPVYYTVYVTQDSALITGMSVPQIK